MTKSGRPGRPGTSGVANPFALKIQEDTVDDINPMIPVPMSLDPMEIGMGRELIMTIQPLTEREWWAIPATELLGDVHFHPQLKVFFEITYRMDDGRKS